MKAAPPDTAHDWWQLHYAQRAPVIVACTPAATRTEILARHKGALRAEPYTWPIRAPAGPMDATQTAAIRAWLALIGETDPATIAHVIEQCQLDLDTREYFAMRAASGQTPGIPGIRDSGEAGRRSIAQPACGQSELWRHPCGNCHWRRTPGAAWPGYCAGREDLPRVYGLLHQLPADLGETCERYRPKGPT